MTQIIFDTCSILGGILFGLFGIFIFTVHKKGALYCLYISIPLFVGAIVCSIIKNSEPSQKENISIIDAKQAQSKDSTQQHNPTQLSHRNSANTKEQPSVQIKYLKQLLDQSLLDDPVSKVQILIIFHYKVKLDSFPSFDIRFKLSGMGTPLYIRAEMFNPTDTAKHPPLRLTNWPISERNLWYKSVRESTGEPPPWPMASNRIYNLRTDTLTFDIFLEHMHQLPFKTLRDFHGMTFTPYFPKEILPLIKECRLMVNEQIIINGEIQKVYWTSIEGFWEVELFGKKINGYVIPSASDPRIEGAKTPYELWKINLHKK
jgi:hypothetical protein